MREVVRNPQTLAALRDCKADGVVRKSRVVVRGVVPARTVKVVTIGCTSNCHGCHLRDFCGGFFQRFTGPMEIGDLIQLRREDQVARDNAVDLATFYCKEYLMLKMRHEPDKLTDADRKGIKEMGLDQEVGK